MCGQRILQAEADGLVAANRLSGKTRPGVHLVAADCVIGVIGVIGSAERIAASLPAHELESFSTQAGQSWRQRTGWGW